jgi:AraC-like DNA-binding protein
MRYALRRPEGPLAGFVQVLWFYEGFARPHAKERLLPDGSMELVINLREDETRVWDRSDLTQYERMDGAVLVGPHSEYFVIDTAEQQCVMGVHFRPGGGFPFLGMPADEMHGQQVSLRDLWGGFARELRERLLAAEGVKARFDLLEAALLRQTLRPLGFHPAVHFAIGQFGAPRQSTVADVVENTGLSARRFIELFRAQVGMSPKQYSRVRRFQRVVQGLGMESDVDWCGVALDAGYCDQSHLIHEFRAISGISPGVWAGLRTEHRNHVPILGA